MRRSALTAIALALTLAGCQGGPTEATDVRASTTGFATTARSCNLLGEPTVVHYETREPSRSQSAVHLLSSNAVTARANGCTNPVPVASVVTLHYRVSGS